MDWSRGFFRIWVVLACLWVLGLGILGSARVANEFRRAESQKDFAGFEAMLPVDCQLARGTIDVDYNKDGEGKWHDFRLSEADKGPYCWYGETKFRPLYPEYGDLPSNELGDKLHEKLGRPPTTARPWRTAGILLLTALLPPFALLMLGAALMWALRGFTPART